VNAIDDTVGNVLDLAARRVEAATGLTFAGPRRRQFDAALDRMAGTLGLPGAAACASWLLAGPWDDARSALCARFLTVGETYFLREPRAFDLVCDQARALLARGATRPLRIWSAGCCTGEEAYSIALALRRGVPQLPPARVDILATDLNDAFLDVARAGIYRRWSFRRTDPADLAAFVKPLGDGRYEIDASLRAQVRFANLNLAEGTYPSAMDVIFCRNVLMYFAPEQAARVVARLRDALVDGGWLVVNASEASNRLFQGLTPVYLEDAVFFRKDTPPVPAPVVAAVAPVAQAMSVPAPLLHPEPLAATRPSAPVAVDDVAMARVHALAQSGAREEALQCLRRAVEAEALSAPLQERAALFALELGDRALARHCVRRLLYLEPDSAPGHDLWALIEVTGRRPDAAAGSAGQWLERLS
jgi:chemotaxis protein methyltransferase CheR